MPHPLVSVIIPTHNRTDFLKLTLESVLNQTYRNFEIIVVDNGTPNDNNFILCQAIEKVRYIKIKNSGGPAKPRNVGIRNSKGKYIAFVDDDDLWHTHKLEQQVHILENNPDFGLVHCCCEVIDEESILKNIIIGRPGSPDVKHGDVSKKMIGNWTLMMPTPVVRKEVFETVGCFNERIPFALEDVEFWTRCSFHTKFYYIDEPLAKYRVHTNNLGNSANYLHLPLYLKAVLKEKLISGRINKNEFNKLLKNLCHSQIKMVKKNLFITMKNLFALNPFWFCKVHNCKLLIFVLFLKKEK
jgi:glycosyltransferase involved in cell wall biosynthesis